MIVEEELRSRVKILKAAIEKQSHTTKSDQIDGYTLDELVTRMLARRVDALRSWSWPETNREVVSRM